MDEATLALLAQLKEYHDPADPSGWPPAPGWWLLAVVSGFLVFKLIRYFLRKRAVHQRRLLALNELSDIGDQANNHPNPWGHQRVAQLLKRTAIEAFPNRSVAALNSQNWLAFLSETSPINAPDLAQLLANSQCASYQSSPPKVDKKLIAACAAWIKTNYPADA